MIMILMTAIVIIPHAVVVGRALVPIVLVVVGFQLLIHDTGQPLKALSPEMMISIILNDDNDDNTDSSNTSRNSN